MITVPPDGETALWRAVIAQAFQDATLGLHGKRPGGKPRRRPSSERRKHLRAARDWLLGDSADFRRVCDMAGLDPMAVRVSATAAIASADRALAESEGCHHNLMPTNEPSEMSFCATER